MSDKAEVYKAQSLLSVKRYI